MFTKIEFLAALNREAKILIHLSSKLQAKHLDFRLTPAQRSTGELLQYLTINAQASTIYFITGTWDHWQPMAEKANAINLAGFPTAIKKQNQAVAKLLKPISDKVFSTRKVKPVFGKVAIPLGQALFENTLTWCIGYRMQLFIQAKAAGLSELGSSDVWDGKDSKKKKG